jgi:hypothetical protein
MREENKSANNQQSAMNEHERRNEGGREFGHIHSPTQAQQASRNEGLADNVMDNRAPRSGTEQGLKRAREGNENAA